MIIEAPVQFALEGNVVGSKRLEPSSELDDVDASLASLDLADSALAAPQESRQV
jgi:hypothetical protein